MSVFYVGGYGGFDRLAAVAVKKAKVQYSDIILMRVLPYHPFEQPIDLPEGFDGSYYPDGLETVPKRYAIARTNRLLVDTCDCLICYVCHGVSNAGKLLEYARRREQKGLLQIINIRENRGDTL